MAFEAKNLFKSVNGCLVPVIWQPGRVVWRYGVVPLDGVVPTLLLDSGMVFVHYNTEASLLCTRYPSGTDGWRYEHWAKLPGTGPVEAQWECIATSDVDLWDGDNEVIELIKEGGHL